MGAPQPPASPLGAIQPDLYTRQDGPLFIGGSPKYGPSLGRLHFRLKYDFDKSDLVVHLIEGTYLLFKRLRPKQLSPYFVYI